MRIMRSRIGCASGCVGLVLLPALLPALALAAAGRQPPAPPEPLGPDPQHLWNRLHDVLLVRTTPDGWRACDDRFPLLWSGTHHLLDGPSREAALRVTDEFLASHGERLLGDPASRLLLQRDLWAVFDWCAGDEDEGPAPAPGDARGADARAEPAWRRGPAEREAAAALQERVARILGRLRLRPGELSGLPDNYRAAVESHAFPRDFDPAHPERPFLPPDLTDEQGPWLCVTPERREHAAAAGGRSAFLVFLQAPGGRRATLDALNRAATERRQFPAGTKMALLERALAVDDAGRVVATPVTESLQVRVFRGEQPPDAGSAGPGAAGGPAWHAVFEFDLDRRDWLAGRPGLRALTDEDRSVWIFERDSPDPFEAPEVAWRAATGGVPRPSPTPTLGNCVNCHQSPGYLSLQSLPTFVHGTGRRGPPASPATSPAEEAERAVQLKARRKDWAALRQTLAGGVPAGPDRDEGAKGDKD